MVFALLSQTLIPWGAMSSGTLLASAYARMTGTELALYAMVPTAALMALVWLPLYWRTASRAGFDPHSGGKTRSACARPAGSRPRWPCSPRSPPGSAPRPRCWRLRPADHAALSARPPPGPPRLRRDRAPHAALCRADRGAGADAPGSGMAGRPGGRRPCRPYADLPAWSPLHAGSWLIAAGVLTARAARPPGCRARRAPPGPPAATP